MGKFIINQTSTCRLEISEVQGDLRRAVASINIIFVISGTLSPRTKRYLCDMHRNVRRFRFVTTQSGWPH